VCVCVCVCTGVFVLSVLLVQTRTPFYFLRWTRKDASFKLFFHGKAVAALNPNPEPPTPKPHTLRWRKKERMLCSALNFLIYIYVVYIYIYIYIYIYTYIYIYIHIYVYIYIHEGGQERSACSGILFKGEGVAGRPQSGLHYGPPAAPA
jgi:hypothetical protein